MHPTRNTNGKLIAWLAGVSLYILVLIILTGEPAVLTGACRYCLNHYTPLAAPTYLWAILAADLIFVGIGFYAILSAPAAKKLSPTT